MFNALHRIMLIRNRLTKHKEKIMIIYLLPVTVDASLYCLGT